MLENTLIRETSPYLLQHAHNPVHWQAWNDDTLQLARTLDKPILVSIGYATCHWCHVMERESFENEQIAAYMNAHYICIKIDREERPDIDQIYMDAVQAMGVGGGWPLNVFLLPDTRPFYGGTYFPPRPMHNRMSWSQILERIADTYSNNKSALLQNAISLTNRLQDMDKAFVKRMQNSDNQFFINENILHTIYKNIDEQLDKKDGGFGAAPKFLGTMSLQYLIQYSQKYVNNTALDDAIFSLTAMLNGGIYDHIGGGISRYATDSAWKIPHFEKMLYDNALLLDTLCDAYAAATSVAVEKNVTNSAFLQKKIYEIVRYVIREMCNGDDGFYTAQDADSEGVEGKFYVWTYEELLLEKKYFERENINEKHFQAFLDFYNIEKEGNWEGSNILYCTESIKSFALRKNLDLVQIETDFTAIKSHFYTLRNKRIKPLRDEKHLLGWNALMLKAFIKTHKVTGNFDTIRRAKYNIFEFLIPNFQNKAQKGAFFHTYKDGIAKYNAFLDDYAYLLDALIELHLTHSRTPYKINIAHLILDITEHLFTYFWDDAAKMFCFASSEQTDLLVRKKDWYDGAQPSGNSTMCINLMKLSLIFDKPEWQEMAEMMLKQVLPAVEQYPHSFARWAEAAFYMQNPFVEVAIVGANAADFARHILQKNKKNILLIFSIKSDIKFSEKHPTIYAQPTNPNDTYIYVCSAGICHAPVQNVEDFFDLLNR